MADRWLVLAAAGLVVALNAALVAYPQAVELDLSWSPRSLVLVAGVVAAAVVMWRRPVVGLVLLVGLVYLNLSEVLVREHDLPSLLQAMFLPLVLAVVALERRAGGDGRGTPESRGAEDGPGTIDDRGGAAGRLVDRLCHPLSFVLALYAALVLASSIVAAQPELGDEAFVEVAKAAAVYALVAALTSSPRRLRAAAATIVAAGTLLATLGVVQTATGRFDLEFGGLARVKDAHIYGDVFEPRIAGPLGDPNFFAQILLLPAALAAVLALHARRPRRRALWSTALALVLAGAVLTYSRGGMLALGVVAAGSLFVLDVDRRKALALVAAGLLLVGVLVPGGLVRLATVEQLLPWATAGEVRADSSFQERRLYMTVAWRMFLDHPGLGVGAGNYDARFDEYAHGVEMPARIYMEPDERQYAHNLYLEIAAETGLAGLVVFLTAATLAFAFLLGARGRLRRRGARLDADLAGAVAVALLGYLVSSLFLHGHFPRYLWLMFGLAAALRGWTAGTSRAPTPPPSPSAAGALRLRRPVGVIVSRFPKVSETFILREIEELERQGQPVVLVSLMRERPPVVHPAARRWLDRVVHVPFLSAGVLAANLRAALDRPRDYAATLALLVRGSAARPASLLKTLAVFPQAVALAERLEEEGVGHLHAHFATHPATAALVISRFGGPPFSFTAHAHDIFVDHSLLEEKLEAASRVRTISSFNRDYLRRLYPDVPADRYRVIHMGIRPELYDADRRDAADSPAEDCPPLVVSVASLEDYKGLPVLLRACRRLRDRGVELRCTIVGHGSRRGRLERLARRLQLDGTVELPGPRDERSVAQLLREASLFVLPSVVAPDGQMEGIPVALMEAMATGVPVVASRLSGIPELVEDGRTGRLVEPGDDAALAAAIAELLERPATARRLAGAARDRVRTAFSVRETAGQLLQLFRQDVEVEVPLHLEAVCSRGDLRPTGLRRLRRRADSTVLELVAPGPEGPREAVLKLHRQRPGQSRPPAERAEREHRMLQRLHELFLGIPQLGVPRPLAVDADAGAVLMERAPGEPLEELLRRARRPLGGSGVGARGGEVAARDRAVAAVRRCGEWLAVFERLEAGGHGDFWPGNVVVEDGAVCLLDLEGWGSTSPCGDLAHFTVHLELYLTAPHLRGLRGELVEAFLDGYRDAGGMLDESAYRDERARVARRILADGVRGRGPARWLRRRMLQRVARGQMHS